VPRDLLAEAQDPATPPGRLRTLTDDAPADRRRLIRAALAVNPSTPPDVLADVAGEHPRDVTRNPALPLLLLEDPGWVAQVTASSVLRMLRAPGVPPVLIAAATAHSDRWVRWEAENHVARAGELAPGEWREAVRAFWWQYAAGTQGEESESIAEMIEYGLLPTGMVDIPPDPYAEGDYVTAHRDAMNQANSMHHYTATVVLSPVATPEILRTLVHTNSSLWLWRTLARHPNSSSDTLLTLVAPSLPLISGAFSASVRRLVFRHPNADARVRAAAVNAACRYAEHSPGLPLCNFAVVASGRHEWRKVAGRPETSPLMRDLPGPVRVTFAALSQDRDALSELGRDVNRVVRAAARARLRGERFTWE
jgi:hypothetical protein